MERRRSGEKDEKREEMKNSVYPYKKEPRTDTKFSTSLTLYSRTYIIRLYYYVQPSGLYNLQPVATFRLLSFLEKNLKTSAIITRFCAFFSFFFGGLFVRRSGRDIRISISVRKPKRFRRHKFSTHRQTMPCTCFVFLEIVTTP